MMKIKLATFVYYYFIISKRKLQRKQKSRHKSILLKKINALKTILMRQKTRVLYIFAKNGLKNVHTFFI